MAEYIEREATKKEFNIHFGDVHDAVIANRLIDSIQAADVAPVVHGRWVASGQCNHKPYRMRSSDHWTTYKCSECGFSNGRRYNDNFCPNCGAKMDGERRTDG